MKEDIMSLNLRRETVVKIKFFFDNWIPPVLRDQEWLWWPLYFFVYRHHAGEYFRFRHVAHDMTPGEIADLYKAVEPYIFQGETDLNDACIRRILKDSKGEKILDIACGRGYLASKLVIDHSEVVGIDFNIDKSLIKKYPKIKFVKGEIEKIPFPNKYFDTVISTHTLEHTIDISKSIAELRRVTKKRLIIVLPKESPHKFGFNLHLHFFPYRYSIYAILGKVPKMICEDIGGDWYICQDIN